MLTDRRHYVTITLTSMIYFLLAMVNSSTAVPSTYLRLFNDHQRGPSLLSTDVSSNSGSSEESPISDFILLRSGRPISLKEFAASLSSTTDETRPTNLVKRQTSAEDSPMLRLARNMPHTGVGEKMYQIHNIGDLPMFRFG